MKIFHSLIFILFVFITDTYSQNETAKTINKEDILIEYLNLKLNENTDVYYNVSNSTVSNTITNNSISSSKVVFYKSKEYSEKDYHVFIDNNKDSIDHPLNTSKDLILLFFSKESKSNRLYVLTED